MGGVARQWFGGVEYCKCRFPLLFQRDNTEDGRSNHVPAAPLVIRCANPTCGHESDYYGRPAKKFAVQKKR